MFHLFKLKKLQLNFTLPFVVVGVIFLVLVAFIAITSSKGLLSKIAQDMTESTSSEISLKVELVSQSHDRLLQVLHNPDIIQTIFSDPQKATAFLKGYLSPQTGVSGVVLTSPKQSFALQRLGLDDTSFGYLYVNGVGGEFGRNLTVEQARLAQLLTTIVGSEAKVDRIESQGFEGSQIIRWQAAQLDGQIVNIGLILSEDFLSNVLFLTDPALPLRSFLVDEKALLLDSNFFQEKHANPGEPAAQHAECWISCTVRNAHDSFGAFDTWKESVFFISEGDNGRIFSSGKPINIDSNSSVAYVFVVFEEWVYVGEIWQSIKWALLASVSSIGILILFGYWTSLKVATPLQQLNESVQRIGKGDWDHRISIERDDEIGDLAKSFSQMANRLRGLVKNLEGLVEERTGDLKELIEKYAKANRELERTNATKDRFFSIIAHDLKSPFMALKGYSGIIEDTFESLDQKQLREMVNKIAVSSEEAHGLLENLLQWAIIQGGAIRVKWEIFDIQEVVLEVFDLMKVNAKVKNVRLICSMEKGVWVEADRNMISTVLRNLISNSIKFAQLENGKVEVQGKRIDSKVSLLLSDNGVGIGVEHQRKLFAKDIYFSEKGTSNERGTGLGLGLCKEFVTMNRGQIEVKSASGEGTQFSIELLAASKPETNHLNNNKKIMVLVVDDSEDNHNLIKIFLKDQPWEISSACNGKEALDILKLKEFQIVLMDINMPVMGGIETTRHLRELEKSQNRVRSHVIAFTSSVLQEDIDAAIGVGCDSYLVKPIKKQKLINSIVRIVGS